MASSSVSIMPPPSSISVSSTNLEMYSLIWADISVNSNENRYAQQQLRSTINHIKVFENWTECETYIRQLKDDQILLIVSGQLGSVIVPIIHSLRQISSIYVYCIDSNKHTKWASKFIKVRAVITDLNELIGKIKLDRNRRETRFDEPLPISIFNSISNEERSSTNINGGFLHFQLLINDLLRPRHSRTSRDEFVELCKNQYKGNHQQLSILSEFEDSYSPEKAAYWYTRHSFLYRMLNKALRVQNVNVLYLFRFFIQDLYQQLKKLHREQDKKSIRVYRSQLISKQELNVLKESKGQLISMNSFLSTTLNRQKSLSFVSFEHGDLCRVLFEIDADSRLSHETKPFADISSQSQFVNEQETLFMIATVFNLVDIRQENDITIIQMELCNGNYNYDMKFVFEYMQEKNQAYHECISFGQVLCTAGMYDEAEQFYHRMLNEFPNNHQLIADLWGSIGLVKLAKGELETSSYWLNEALKKYKQLEDPIGCAKSLQNLGNIHSLKREFDQAINKYSQALNIYEELSGDQNESIANCLSNLGVAYFEKQKFTEAVQYYIRALSIREIVLPHAHPDIARTLNNIGNVYFSSAEYDQALQYFMQALSIYEISLPSEHPSIAQAYYNMGLAYLAKSDRQRALVFFNRAASIHRNRLSPNHPDVLRCVNTIDYVVKNDPSQNNNE